MADDRPFDIVVTRAGFGPGSSDEVFVAGAGVDHGDGTATVTPAEGLPGAGVAAEVQMAELTEGFHPPVSVALRYDDQG